MNANELTFGVEIETTIPVGTCTVGGHGCGLQVPWLPEGWLADHDPSIHASNGRRACEFVSPVLKGAEGVRQLIAAIKTISEKGGQVNQSCGLHVHVGFDRSDVVTLERLITLVSNHEKGIFATTGTKSRETGRWCNGVRHYGNVDMARRCGADSRYHVLNITSNKPTVEFRAFAATLNITKILGYVRLCIALVEKAQATARKTKWVAKSPVATSPIHRSGEGHTEVTRLFYALGWIKGREKYEYGNVTLEDAPTTKEIKKQFVRLAKKYDSAPM